MTLILNDVTAIHWAVAGAAIAAITLALLFLANRRLGISTGFEDVCSLRSEEHTSELQSHLNPRMPSSA